MPAIDSVPDVLDAIEVRGAGCPRGATPSLLLEVPHGATLGRHYDALRRRLRSALPDDLVDFFFVNTDAGAPELSVAIAERYVAARPHTSAVVLRSLVPRTFVDCNRLLGAAREDPAHGGITAGVPPYIRDPADLGLLRALHRSWAEAANAAFEAVCGAGGLALMVHTYAARTVDVAVDDDIVTALRAAYVPEVFARWPVRPAVDLIVRTPDGELGTSPALLAAVVAALDRRGITATQSETYPLHPATPPYFYAARYPEQTLCFEVRRDLLTDDYHPFAEMKVSPARVGRFADALAEGVLAFRA